MSSAQEPITNLADYIAEINKIAVPNSENRYIYRGQKNATWHIQSGALRRLKKEPLRHPELLPYLFRGYIHQIIDEVQLRYSSVYNNLTALECMAHLQHNRVATGLIDFTYNPLVALWFACETDGATDGKVFVVNVQPDKVREVKTKGALGQKLRTFFKEDGQWHLWQPSIDNSAVDTQRITMQQSVFLFGLPEVELSMIKREILIPKEHKETLLQELETMGISEKILFSDLAGFFERNDAASAYNRDLAEDYYTEEIRKAKAQGMNKEALSENYFQRANVRVASGKYEKAIADYDRAIDLNSDLVGAYNGRGITKSKLSQHEAAIADYDKAIELDPDYTKAYNNRGNARRHLGQYKEAIADYDTALALNPHYASAYYNRGLANGHLKRYEEARADFQRALALATEQGYEEWVQAAQERLNELPPGN